MVRFDLNLLVAFDALLRAKNVSVAAEEVGVSQPAMSGMLKRLREHLQDPILVRVGSQYELSARALELSEPIRQALLMVEDATRPSNALRLVDVRRHVKIMASEFSQLLILPGLFRQAIDVIPHVTFEVLPIIDPISRVYLGDVDLCITAVPLSHVPEPAAALIRGQKILEGGFVAIVDPKHPISSAPTIEEIFSYPHVETQFPGLATSVDGTIVPDRGRHHAPVIKAPSFVTAAPMIVDTDRICFVPEALFELIAKPWKLRAVRLPDEIISSPLRILWHVRHDMDPLQRWLRATIQREAEPFSDRH